MPSVSLYVVESPLSCGFDSTSVITSKAANGFDLQERPFRATDMIEIDGTTFGWWDLVAALGAQSEERGIHLLEIDLLAG